MKLEHSETSPFFK